MTQRAINLYDGLEALYYFDPTYYDGTTGEIKDKSGHERHASAEGGPTIGVNGPNEFEATNFDRSDDRFIVGSDAKISPDDAPVTLFASFKSDSNATSQTVINASADNDKRQSLGVNGNNSEVNYGLHNTGEVTRIPNSVTDSREWNQVTAVLESDKNPVLYYKGERFDNNNGDLYAGNNDTIVIGEGAGNNRHFGGKIAVIAGWSRALSDAERAYLDRLTAPRRAQL